VSAPKVPAVVVDLIVRVGAKLVEELAEAILRDEDPFEATKRAARHAAVRESAGAALDALQRELGKP